MRYTLRWGAVAILAVLAGPPAETQAADTNRSLVPPVRLPDGQEFQTWEVPLRFGKSVHVNPAHPKASDDNPGTEAMPLKTINRAAQLVEPGQRVVIGAGVYRERVCPARGGAGPEQIISYEAAPGAKVVLSGSRVVSGRWTRDPRAQHNSPPVWKITLPADWFADENPFREVNLTDQQIDRSMDWAVPTKGKPPNTLRRGLVFQDGKRLQQVAAWQDLAKAAGAYWVEADGLTLCVRPRDDADPNQAQFEATTLGMIFAPRRFGLGYIRVKGLTIQHAGNCFPRPQQGALSTLRGHHWIIEDNVVRQCNAIGIDIGDQFDTSGPGLAEGGRHIVRRNVVTDCGIGGIEGTRIQHTLLEDNFFARCGWQRAQYIWETGAIKVHTAVNTLIRRNLVQGTIDAPGIWMDWQNRNSRCTQNVIVGARSVQGGIFMEASQVANLVDHNVVWGTTGSGIYQHDCDELVIAHNFVGHSSDAGIRMQICRGRMVGGRLSTAKRNQIFSNVLVGNGSPLAISDPENSCDYNLFGPNGKPFDLGAWQKKHSWDRNSVVAEVQARFDPDAWELTWAVRGKVPEHPRPGSVTHDFFGRPYPGRLAPPGPFGAVPADPVPLRLGCLPAAAIQE